SRRRPRPDGAAVSPTRCYHGRVADEIEGFFERGVTDGLPVVPPTRTRVDAMLATTRRDRQQLVAEVPPNFGRATVEKLAVNAVMAGCRPDYFPVVLAVVEAACDPAFNLHGQSGTTNATSPLVIINGPVRGRLGVNCAAGVFGPRRVEPQELSALRPHAARDRARAREDHRGGRLVQAGREAPPLRDDPAPREGAGTRPRRRGERPTQERRRLGP